MERKEFIKKFGLGTALVISGTCVQSCLKPELKPGDGGIDVGAGNDRVHIDIDITFDLNGPEFFFLQFPEGYVVLDKHKIVIAKSKDDGYIAAIQICSDENLPGMIYQDGEWYCFEHDATFDHTGVGTTTHNNKGFRGIQVFNTELNGHLLRIYS